MPDPMEFTGERFTPEIHGNIELEHVHRYLHACELAADKVVLDIASGEGYGSAMLAKRACKVIGVDNSIEAIQHARGRYKNKNLEYMVGSCADIPLSDASVDMVVSFETIEHHDQHEQMMQEIKRVLHPTGMLLISSQDKYHYSVEPDYSNPFHVQELYQHEFKELLGRHFKNAAYFGQRIIYGSCVFAESLLMQPVSYWQENETIKKNQGLVKPTYWIALASDVHLPELALCVFEQPINESEIIKSWSGIVAERDGQIGTLTQAMTDQEAQLGCLAQAMTERDERIATLAHVEAERDEQIVTLAQAMTDRDEQIGTLTQVVAARDGQIGILTQAVAERDEQIGTLTQSLADRDGQLAVLDQALFERGKEIGTLTQAVVDRDEQLAALHQAVGERDGMIRKIETHSRDLKHAIHAFQNSRSWKITAPLRAIAFRLRLIRQQIQWYAFRVAQGIYQRLPISFEAKQKMKSAFFVVCAPVFRETMEYRNWDGQRVRDDIGPVDDVWDDGQGTNSRNGESETHVAFSVEPLPANLPVKLLAFYLPQFHPIPENDEWWGKGFTEWTNVSRALPQFEGHYQPHFPADLGFYDLRLPEIQHQQVELAKAYGLGGFCFYFYWFSGKRLLEHPIRQYLKNTALDFPFCLCWANENWSRRWDGRGQDVLIGQNHSAEDDLAFIAHVAEYMRDPRYICIGGRPLLILYRPSLLSNPAETAERWREWCRDHDLGEIYLAYTQSFEAQDPNEYGFDAAIEFPPNNSNPPLITQINLYNKDFKGMVFDWGVFVERSRNYMKSPYPLFRGVCPSWDNEARRPGVGTSFLGSSPEGYQEWLENACADTMERFDDPDKRLVFINAWNEWAEGAHLEPDQRYGFAWLQATRNALVKSSSSMNQRKIVLVSHDAHPHGAQYLTLHLAQTLVSDFGYQVDLVLLGEGTLASEFARWATVHHLFGMDPCGVEAVALVEQFVAMGHEAALVNTTVSGLFLETLADAGLRCVALIHELRGVIESGKLEAQALAITRKADVIVFPASQVVESFNKIAHVPVEKIKIKPQGLYKRNRYRGDVETARIRLRQDLGLEENTKIVLGVGYADYRKGVDLFVDSGLKVLEIHPHTYFVWVGHWESTMRPIIEQRLAGTAMSDHFLFLDHQSTDLFYAGANVYALTSREDPFPAVALEALEVAVPVVGFKDVGGIEALLENGCGMLVPKEDTTHFAEAICVLLADSLKSQEIGQKGSLLIQESFSFRHYLFDLLGFAGEPLKRISVVVPNYNYARHLEQRLNTIFSQTYPIYEIIVLDDASTDNSIEVIERCLSNTAIDHRLVRNSQNSGSVFQQWRKAVELARGDFVWICEADDHAAPTFVERSIRMFDDPQVVMSYTQSRQIDESDNVLCDNYFDYTADICTERWKSDYLCDGKEELSQALAVKNTIPNVSAVIFQKSSLQQSLRRCQKDLLKLKIAGDWLIYSDILQNGRVGFVSEALNSHRRHQKSVTHSSFSSACHMAEIIFLQKRIAETVFVEEAVQTKARKYTEEVYRQFSLGTNGHFKPMEDPEVLEVLKTFSDIG